MNAIACSISASSCVAIAVKPAPVSALSRSLTYAASTSSLLRVRDLRRLEVRALDEAEVRGKRQQGLEIGFAAVEVRLEDGADVVVACFAEPAVDAERGFDARRLLHIHAEEVAVPRGMPDELRDIPVRELLVEREAKVRQLERDVRAEAFRRDPVEELAVRGDDRSGLGLGRDALAEERRVREQALVVQAAQDGHGGVEALSRDEARGTEPEAVPLHEPPDGGTVGGGRGSCEDAQRHSSTMRSTSPRSAPVRPRSGARTSGSTGTPRSPSAVFAAAWKGSRCSDARSAVACS